MEADWEFEIGSDAPIIDAHWEGLVDLRREPHRVGELAETQLLPDLAEVLVRLNSATSPAWTCKTDIFIPERIDADELDATSEEAVYGIACYVDLLRSRPWQSASDAEQSCRKLCDQLRKVPLRQCAVDLVIRRAHAGSGLDEVGVTAYLTACGLSESDARDRLAACLKLFAELVTEVSPTRAFA